MVRLQKSLAWTYLFDKVVRVREEFQQLEFQVVVGSGDASSVGGRGADDDGPWESGDKVSYSCNSLAWTDALGFSLLGHLCLELVNRLVGLGVSVCTLDEGCSLAVENGLGALKIGVNQADDLESRAELVFESERVASESIAVSHRAVSRLLITHFHGPSSLPNMMFYRVMSQRWTTGRRNIELTPAPIIKTLKSAPGAGGEAL